MTTVETVLQGFGLRTDQGSPAFCGIYLLRDGSRNILVDVGHVGRRSLLLAKLAERGIGAGDIDSIVLTHAHWDHCLNVDVFPNARVFISAPEYDYVKSPNASDWATPVWTRDVLARNRIEETRDGDEIAAGVRILATPGHSPGSQTVVVETPEGIVGLPGDALPNPACIAAGICYLVFYSEDAARKSVSRILEHCAFVYPGHDRPFRVGSGGAYSYLEHSSVNISRLPGMIDGGAGLTFNTQVAAGTDILPWARGGGA